MKGEARLACRQKVPGTFLVKDNGWFEQRLQLPLLQSPSLDMFPSHSGYPMPADVQVRRHDFSQRLVIALVVEVPD